MKGAKIFVEGPRPCNIFCFSLMQAMQHYVTNTFLLVNTSVRGKQLVFRAGSRPKKRTKTCNKELVRVFHNDSHSQSSLNSKFTVVERARSNFISESFESKQNFDVLVPKYIGTISFAFHFLKQIQRAD